MAAKEPRLSKREIDFCPPSSEDLAIPRPVFQQAIAAVRDLLTVGLPRETSVGCVRLRKFEPYGGGLKSSLVGGLSVHLGLTLKIGDLELDDCRPLFEAANSAGLATKGLHQPVFPACHCVLPLEGDPEHRLAIMDHLRSYESLFDIVAHRAVDPKALYRAVHRATLLLDVIHSLPMAAVKPRASSTGDLYFGRLRAKLRELSRWNWIGRARATGIILVMRQSGSGEDEVRLPGVDDLLDEIERRLPTPPQGAAVVLHGDPHLGNIMLRKNGSGFRVRMIDPNPAWGAGDYLYDIGKLIHFTGEVGLVREDAARAVVSIDDSGAIPVVRAPEMLEGIHETVRNRQRIVKEVLNGWRNRRAATLGEQPDGPRFHLAVATATLATASMLKNESAVNFILHRAFWHLAQASRGLGLG